MSSSYTVELNQNMASWSRPGEYEVQLAQPISIDEGDSLAFRMASLDSNITDQDTILLVNDEILTAKFSYYEVNYNGADKASYPNALPVTPDYSYYTAYNNVQLATVTGIDLEVIGYQALGEGKDPLTSTYIIGTNGVGSNVDPAVNFSAYFTYIDASGNIQTVQFTGSNAKYNPSGPVPYYTDNANGTLALQVTTPFTMRVGTLRFSGVQGYWPGAENNIVQKQLTFIVGAYVPRAQFAAPTDDFYPYQLDDFTLGAVTYSLGAPTGFTLDVQSVTVTLKAGRYNPGALAVQLTQLFSAAGGLTPKPVGGDQIYAPINPFLIRTDDPRNGNMVFNRVPNNRQTTPIVFQNGQSYTYSNPATPGVIAPYYVGTTEFSIEYGAAGQVFQVSYNHMPMSDPARPGEQDIALYTSGSPGANLQFHAVTSASGILFHDLQPITFWENRLGLRSKLIVPLMLDSNGLEYYTLAAMQRSITFGFQGLSSFLLPPTGTGNPVTYPDFRKMSPLKPTTNPLYLNCTGQSRAIVGDTITINQVGGYFLIEVLNVFRSTGGYIDNSENRRSISAIVSTQMDNNNCITGYSDGDTAGYVHRGASYLISSAVVRILNPLTKQPVTTLGVNNCIWLQIDKLLQQQTQTVAHPKKKPIIKRREVKAPPEEQLQAQMPEPQSQQQTKDKIKVSIKPRTVTQQRANVPPELK